MVSNIALETTAQHADPASEKAKLKQEKQDFFKLFLTTIQNQDPSDPTDTSTLSQLSLLFQNTSNMIDIKTMLADAVSDSSKDFLGMASIFDENINLRVKSDEMYLNSVDSTEQHKEKFSSIDYELPQNMKKVDFTITNQYGQTVKSETMKSLSAGMHTYQWDGKILSSEHDGAAASQSANPGLYKVEVTGVTYNDQKTNIQTFARVVPESYSNDGNINYYFANSDILKTMHKDDIVGLTKAKYSADSNIANIRAPSINF